MAPRPSLRLRMPPAVGTGLQDEFTDKATRYWHTNRGNGGNWEAGWFFPLDGSRGLTPSYLRWWFHHQLGARIEEVSGGVVTWEGIVWSMELTLDGITRRMAIHDDEETGLFNRVRADYTDENGKRDITSWYSDTESQARYGIRELIVPLRLVSQTEAQSAAQAWLKQTAWPRPVPIRLGGEPGLLVECAGDVFTANYQYVDTTAADLTTANISTFVSAIVGNDCEFLSSGRIETNTMQRRRQFDRLMRGWEGISELVQLSDSTNQNPWRAYVSDGLLHYEQRDTTPIYRWYGDREKLETTAGALDPWAAKPGVLRDMVAPAGTLPSDEWLTDRRDMWIEEVQMAFDQDTPELSPGTFDANAVLRAQNQYLRWLEREEEREEASG